MDTPNVSQSAFVDETTYQLDVPFLTELAFNQWTHLGMLFPSKDGGTSGQSEL